MVYDKIRAHKQKSNNVLNIEKEKGARKVRR
jgi:hypothetical protein